MKDNPALYVPSGTNVLRDQQGRPGVKPPWGTLTAVDLNAGEIRWKMPLGDFNGMKNSGTQNFGGSIVTAGGLVFIASTMDAKMRAFDKATGAKLWEAELPAAGYAAPCTYSIGGRQYIVVAAGGGGKSATPTSDAYVAFALPE